VVWRSPDSGYTVLRLATDDGEHMVVGDLGGLLGDDELDGVFLAVEGRFEDHAVHGRQLKATGVLQGLPRTLAGLETYLASSSVPGIGPVLAKRIVARFGERALTVLADEPYRLVEVPGISKKRAKAISERWRRDEEGRALVVQLLGLGLTKRLIQRIRVRYGDATGRVVTKEPYRMIDDVPGVGFRTADTLAAKSGVAKDDPARVAAAVDYALSEATSEGHCFLSTSDVAQAVAKLDVPVDRVPDAIAERARIGRLIVDEDRVFLPRLYEAERDVAAELTRIDAGREPARIGDVEEVARAARWLGVTLDPTQAEAVRVALQGGVTVITGGPGTGKTTLVQVLVRALRERGRAYLLASPTGRAAKRLAEASGEPAKTIHRLLEYRPDEGGFQRSVGQPLEGDGVLVDEASMVDVDLLRALCLAVPDGAALVLVGDADQLPSVGPGRVLADLVASGAFPVARLTTVHRQADGSGIVVAANRVLRGEAPSSDAERGDFFVVERQEPEAIVETVRKVVTERLPARGFDPRADVLVLTPTRRGPVGVEGLNAALQEAINPKGQPVGRGKSLRVGDRVLCVRNRYDLELFNGDLGVVVGRHEGGVDVDWDGQRKSLAWDDLDDVELAWATTVHKSQGGEMPAVVVVLHPSHHLLLRRSLLYTAITRARRFLCVVAHPTALRRAVADAHAVPRNTTLAERLTGPHPADPDDPDDPRWPEAPGARDGTEPSR
jgi:exodeoxyribonuclease V alpha subunit